jgi:uncharacterized membrane protein
MAAEPSAKDLFELAKDAGNKLRAYMLSYSSGATAVFFLALTGKDVDYSQPQKNLLVVALVLYVATTLLCLIELRVDAYRFFHMGKDLETGRGFTESYLRRTRLTLIYASYATALFATVAMVRFLISRIT